MLHINVRNVIGGHISRPHTPSFAAWIKSSINTLLDDKRRSSTVLCILIVNESSNSIFLKIN
jgi:hypothetical protein